MLAFFEWKSAWWLEQADRREVFDHSVQSGLVAYAHKQSNLCLQMAACCAAYWLPVMEKHGVTPPWSSKYTVSSIVLNHSGSTSDSEDDEDVELDQNDGRSDSDEMNVDDILDFE